MSDHAEKKKDDKPAEGGHGDAGAKKGGIGGLLTKLPVLLGGAMTVEAVVLLVAFKLLAGGPKAADASVDLKDAAADHAAADEDNKDAGHGEKADAHDAKPAKDDGGHDAGHGDAGGHDAKPAEDHGGGHDAKPAKAEGGHGDAAAAEAPVSPNKPVELPVVEFRAPNKVGGRTFLYDVSIYAVVKAKHKPVIEAAIKDRGALLKDRIRTIIAQSDPDKLGGGAEPGLETLRRQVKYQLDEIVGAGLVDEVLVPRCIPFRTDF